jgi:cobalamin biosynthesis Mg chelatase CobN
MFRAKTLLRIEQILVACCIMTGEGAFSNSLSSSPLSRSTAAASSPWLRAVAAAHASCSCSAPPSTPAMAPARASHRSGWAAGAAARSSSSSPAAAAADGEAAAGGSEPSIGAAMPSRGASDWGLEARKCETVMGLHVMGPHLDVKWAVRLYLGLIQSMNKFTLYPSNYR